jgi:flagellar biosynthesis regulator FlaF
MKTITIEYAKMQSDKVSGLLETAQKFKAVLASTLKHLAKAKEQDDKEDIDALENDVAIWRRGLVQRVGEASVILRELSESEILHGEQPL